MATHKGNLINLIEQASYRYSTYQVFSDFIELASLSISNSIDKTKFQEREKRYLEVIKKYDSKEATLFPMMLAELVQALEEEMTDVLGEIFMQMGLGSDRNGQFFTPMSVCRATASMALSNIKEVIAENGFVTFLEPTCGGGALVIAVAEYMKNLGINYQQTMKVTAIDLDLKAVHMCYLQLSLLGIPAVVYNGNTLSMEMFSEWKTPTYILGGWWYKKQKKKVEFKTMGNGQISMII